MTPPVHRIGPYRVLRPLGRGAQAVVLEAAHETTGERVALKLLRVADGPHRARIRQEVAALSRIEHRNVVRLLDFAEAAHTVALAMELVEGPTLRQALADGAFTVEQADDLGHQLITGLGAIHAAGVLHRDLKPENILLAVGATGPTPKLADLGLARVIAEDPPRLTRTGTILGAVAYRAPEMSTDAKRADHRADLFSMGAVLYELLSGAKAFSGPDSGAIAEAIAEGRYTPLREQLPDVAERHVEAIARALRPDLDQRAQTAGELLAVWEGRGETGTGRVAPTRAWDGAAVERLRQLWLHPPEPEVDLDALQLPTLEEPPEANRWLVVGIVALLLAGVAAMLSLLR